MDTTHLTWRDKLRILDVTARIAVSMFVVGVAFSELVVVAIRR